MLPYLLLIFALAHAFDIPAIPSKTATVNRPYEHNPDGHSPWPTQPPEFELRRALRARDNGLTSNCAWLDGQSLTCPPNQYCAYNTILSYMGCCSVDNGGNFVSDCGYSTTCINLAQVSTLCQVNGCGASTGICGGVDTNANGQTETHYPFCRTEILTVGTLSLTTFGCATVDGETLYLSATSESGITTSPGPQTTTTNPSPSPHTSSPSSQMSTSQTSPPPTPTNTGSPSHTGAIAGGVVGGVAGLAIIGGIIGFIVYRIKKKQKEGAYMDTPEMTGTTFQTLQTK